ncbi:unnamed protein product [Ceratitis capitata]|uniref:(Mediterranean fruit fly) hypothetical protein n=1 Tax=Ceratitis capitata TaxID=7213 RepID=A0A811VEP6_CERCA|nr:unnamed protein product [Ceratitis capitata]
METYKALVTNKTSCHLFTLPIAGALHLAGITEKQKQIFSECEAIAFELGHLGQVQNDYLDCFGDPTLTGKIGTDIEANKCTWLAVKCLELASMDQQAIMVECYGQNDAEKILRVKELYKVLDLPSIYTQFEKEAIGRIKKLIQQSSSAVPHDVFSEILTQLSRREIK